MPIGIYFIAVALFLYTVAIWSEKIKGRLAVWMVKLMIGGFISDLIGTGTMFIIASSHRFGWHSFCGYLALIIIGVHLFWAIKAWQKSGRAAHNFHRFSLIAWICWLVAFFSGIPNIK